LSIREMRNYVAELGKALLTGWGEGVKPVDVHEVELHGTGGQDVLDAEGDENFFFADGAFDLAAALSGVVGMGGEDEEDDLALVEGVDDGGAPLSAGGDVAGGDPAGDAVGFQGGAGGVGDGLVFAGVADEDLVRHRAEPWGGVERPVGRVYLNG
jgi:hypothetical protein